MDMQSNYSNNIQITLKEDVFDVIGDNVRKEATKFLRINTGKVKSSKVYSVLYKLSEEEITEFANNALKDSVINDVYINKLYENQELKSYVLVSKLPGVTDDEGISAQKTLYDYFNINLEAGSQQIFTHNLYYIEEKLSDELLKKISEELLGNPLVNHFEFGKFHGKIFYIPSVEITSNPEVKNINIFVSDNELIKLSKDMLLSLDLNEMKAIKNYYNKSETKRHRLEVGLPEIPTDCELEIFGQTWSEHCKHKEFNALVYYKNLDTGEEKVIDSLFRTYIKKSTEIIQNRLESAGNNWLLKIFSDNAGVARIDKNRVFVWKVETHNSPSALDPYGGALTGIVGVNRDPFGTGVGGGKFLFNTDVLCFGSPYYEGKLLPGQLHPRRILSGVVKGIEDGGNKSGIPTVNGSVIFDDRYRGKPLVFCGTGAIMPSKYNGRNSWEKRIDNGDRIVMIGGRVGKDGIHGATFSSLEIDEHSPRSAVQIGSPITQRNLYDFMVKAVNKGLIKASTDNGAGGLSSSVGELAQITDGAVVNLEKVPLKYAGLQPWEIFVSESQERMTLVIEPQNIDALFEMAADFEVEATDIGYFNPSGFLDVRYNNTKVAYLDLNFLHSGVPTKTIFAEWGNPKLSEPEISEDIDYNSVLIKLMGSLNICARELIIRRYDHEVKGKTTVKPLMGENGFAPQDAAVMRLDFDSYLGIAISNGICPKYGDIDPYEMSAGAFDEAIRQIISIGGKLPEPSENDIFWSVNDNFCMPDAIYNKESNPDGMLKFGKLVRMNEALFDMATFFNIPMTSGKDSMKNDFIKSNVKISIPPTILYSAVAKIEDIRKTVTSDFKKEGDLICLVGKTYNELGGSEFYNLFDELGKNVPIVRKEEAKRIYLKMIRANDKNLINSSHDISNGGLAVAIVESAFGGNFGAEITLRKKGINLNAELFSESHSRFVVSVSPDKQSEFEDIFGNDSTILGRVTNNRRIKIFWNDSLTIDLETEKLLDVWREELKF
jgi:phosphoribosylformylglycinamidine synthase